ncbi:MAG: zinc-dependent peptidase [Bacteriovorax sp.]|nr:zinc-dependent peptidase [Bacteriovorax sp.]
MKYLIIFSLFSSSLPLSLLADDCVSCSQDLKPFDGIVKNVEVLQTSTEINCVDQLKENAREEYLVNFGNLPKKKAVIKGLNLEGSADELKFLKKMLNAKPTTNWSKASQCKTVICALTKVYNSEESAHRALNIAKRDGYIVSASRDFNINNENIGQLFSLEELQKIDLAYKMLPPKYKRLKSLGSLKRMPNGYSDPETPDAVAFANTGSHSRYYNSEGDISFLDTGFSGEQSWGPLVAVHELTHHLDFSSSDKLTLGISESPEFLKLSGWKSTTNYETDKKSGKKTAETEWEHALDKKFVRDYAGSEPAEDLAESTAYYVYFPNKLKALDPEKYDFIKNKIFDGKEYLSAPELRISESDILKICIENHKEFSLYGNLGFSDTKLMPSCLDKYIKDFKYTDPKLCNFNTSQIKNYLFDKIDPLIQSSNDALKQCDQNLVTLSNQCLSEGNFQNNCAIEKCNLQSPLKEKVKDTRFVDQDTLVMKSIETKLGRQNFLSTILINGLSEKNNISEDDSIIYQKNFSDNASKALAERFDKENFKFDSKDNAMKNTQRYLTMDKGTSESLSSFQITVLKNATRSKEKNLELIKNWAASQSLNDTPMYDELAETLRKYGGGFFGKN